MGPVPSRLIVAASEGNVEEVNAVLANGGPEVEGRDSSGMTALMWASREGYLEVVEVLLNHGASHKAASGEGLTALSLASCRGHTDVVRLLMRYGADINVRHKASGITPLIMATCAPAAKDKKGQDAMAYAKGSAEMTSLLEQALHLQPPGPEIICGFRVEKELGRGSFGRVVKVVNIYDSNEYALKVLTLNEQANRAFCEEVKIASRLGSHANTITYYSCFEDERDSTASRMCIQMELGRCDLTSLFGPNFPPPASVRQLARGIAEGIKHIHDNGVLHRDLKLNNIIIGQDGQPKICDFGISILTHGTDTDGQTEVGTEQYKAPEILCRQPYGFPADIWAYGIIILELSLKELIEKLVKDPGDASSREALERTLHDAVSSDDVLGSLATYCLAREPDHRCIIVDVIEYFDERRVACGALVLP